MRGGLARIERRRIPSRWARTAQGGVDCVALGSHYTSRTWFTSPRGPRAAAESTTPPRGRRGPGLPLASTCASVAHRPGGVADPVLASPPRGASLGVVAIPAGSLASRGPLARETDARWIGAAVREIAGVPAMVAVRPAAALLEGPWRRRLSKSVAKARILPGCVKRNVDIPHFLSPPIPPRSAFATDPDMPLPRNVSGAPRAPLLSRPWSSAPSCRSASSARRADVRARARIRSRATASPARWSASGRRPILPLPGADYSARRRIHGL